jgi:hypothetical protein
MGVTIIPFQLTGSVLSAQASVGVATTDTAAADSQQLLSQADVALGEAKAAGKGRRQRYEASMHEQVLKRRQLRTDLDEALADDALQVYYQPIVELSIGAPRRRHRVDGLVVEADCPGRDVLQPGDHGQGGRLAAARRAEDDQQFAVGDVEAVCCQ